MALDPAGTLVGLDDFREQATYSFINLGRALEASGAHYSDIVKLNYYLTDVSDIPVLREVRDTFIAADRRPASTAVQVAALFEAGLLIEIDATAVVTH
ncbi:Enamine/imine deaminase [Pseudonocardia autotrophica]|uniref:Enamine/imine deaminase n=1 Tax=Pseudonocardia autotrophica TaxID=2074 RepID=A0A1Y2MM23_PSEAH|nr:Enamine/imine deaminase [Pseudonocardia autotrophica]